MAGLRVTGWHIDAFGQLADAGVQDVGPGLTVLHGPNEAGKTTMMVFLRRMLYGFPDRRTREHRDAAYDPVVGGSPRGRLYLEAAGPVTVERLGRRVRVKTLHDDGGEDLLAALLQGTDDEVFRTVYAFGVSELQRFDSLDADGVREALFSAGIRGAATSARAARTQLEEAAATRFLARGRKHRLGAIEEELGLVEADLRAARVGSAAYAAVCEQERLARAEVEHARARRRRCEQDEANAVRLLDLWPTWLAVEQARSALAEMPAAEGSPLPPREVRVRLRALVQRRDDVERLRNDHAAAERRLDELGSRIAAASEDVGVTADQLALVAGGRQVRDRIRQAVTDDGRTRVRLAALGERLAALPSGVADEAPNGVDHALQDLAVQQQRHAEAARRDDLGAGLVVLVAAVSLVAGLAFRGGTPVVGLVAAAVAVALAATATRRRRHIRSVRDRRSAGLIAARARVADGLGVSPATTHDDLVALVSTQRVDALRRADQVAEAAQAAAAALNASSELELVESTWAGTRDELGLPDGLAVTQALEVVDAAARVRDALHESTSARGDRERAEAELRAIGDDLGALAADLEQVTSSGDLLADLVRLEAVLDAIAQTERAAQARSDTELDLRTRIEHGEHELLARTGVGVDAQQLRASLATGSVAAWEDRRDVAATERALADATHEQTVRGLADLERERVALGTDERLSNAESRRSLLVAERERVVREWAVRTLAAGLIEDTVAAFERDRQPRVLAEAGAAFARVTSGRYVALRQHEDELIVIAADGRELATSVLSRGTAALLYLTLRIALARVQAERTVALPFVMDDVLVDLDPERAAAFACELADLARTHQVLYFTCHPHVVGLLTQVDPTTTVIAIAGHRRAGLEVDA